MVTASLDLPPSVVGESVMTGSSDVVTLLEVVVTGFEVMGSEVMGSEVMGFEVMGSEVTLGLRDEHSVVV